MDEYSILAQNKYNNQCYLVMININEENQILNGTKWKKNARNVLDIWGDAVPSNN